MYGYTITGTIKKYIYHFSFEIIGGILFWKLFFKDNS